MAHIQPNVSNRINPVPVSVITQAAVPQPIYDEVALCADPNCPVCRAQRRDKRQKHRKKHHHHHHHHHHHRHRTNFWNSLLPRVESPMSVISVHGVEFNDRSIVPVNQTERQVVSTTRTQPVRNEEIVEDAWSREPLDNDEVVCCRAYNGCRCPCWCFIILIILFVILIITLIVLLATLL